MRKLLAVAAVLAFSAAAFAAPKTRKHAKAAPALSAGAYTAHVKVLVCEGCKANIEQTLQGFKAIEGVSVDQEKSTLRFEVKKGAKVSVASLQRALKKSSDGMGMGADYTLHDIARVDAAPSKK